jgi:hypothetical protein
MITRTSVSSLKTKTAVIRLAVLAVAIARLADFWGLHHGNTEKAAVCLKREAVRS